METGQETMSLENNKWLGAEGDDEVRGLTSACESKAEEFGLNYVGSGVLWRDLSIHGVYPRS